MPIFDKFSYIAGAEISQEKFNELISKTNDTSDKNIKNLQKDAKKEALKEMLLEKKKMIDKMEEDDDVLNVFHNMDMSE